MSLLAAGAMRLVRGYQRVVSPFLPRACRFFPTCSEYSWQVFRWHGVARGSWLTVRRLVRCQPLHPGGYDPPPPA
ncbi:MAG: membrane protein insertion efficiency factor YidD [Candidatus Rokubacteria bacterium]|nr:membrane protein insertion efficiency factor YidD [Candidatus Rokubacteria bacterium]